MSTLAQVDRRWWAEGHENLRYPTLHDAQEVAADFERKRRCHDGHHRILCRTTIEITEETKS